MTTLIDVLTREHNSSLILLSILVAASGSLLARAALVQRVATAGWRRRAWLFAGVLGLLSGIVGSYALTVFAAFPFLEPIHDLMAHPSAVAVVAFGVAGGLSVAVHARPGYRDLLFAGALLAGGIACMLFMALSSLAQPNRLAWELLPVTGTVLFASALCGLGLVGVGARGTPMQQLQGASCLAAAQIVLSMASLTSILSFSDWLNETTNPASLASNPILVVISACGLVMAGLGLTGAAIDHRTAQLNRRESDRMRQLADSALEGILIYRGDRAMDANAAFCELAALPLMDVRGRAVSSFFRGSNGAVACDIATLGEQGEIELLTADGPAIPVEVIARSIRYRDGPAQVLAVRDVRDRRKAEDQIRHLAQHDALTGLVNRALLRERLGQLLAGHFATQNPFAVMCLDLDRFKAVNDTMGHASGDELLLQVAHRLRSCVLAHETVARTGGDEFVILQAGIGQPQAAESLAGRLIAAVSAPYDLDGKRANIGVSVGIAVCPQDGVDAEQLLFKADLALYRAKTEGRGMSCFFEPAMEARVREQRRLERDLRSSLGSDQITLQYQPQYSCAAEPALVGFEALMRWNHPERGFIPPTRFIPVAEETGMIGPLGLWALERACLDAVTWPPECRVAVNLSPAQFRSGDLFTTVMRALDRTGLLPSRLELEVTESLLIGNPEEALRYLAELKAVGVRIALDDFGTGYSSLSYLQRFPFDKLKIDKSFIEGINHKPDSRAIVEAILAMSRSLRLEVTAEGVETREQLAILQELSCGSVQGYLLGRPMDRVAVSALLATRTHALVEPVS